LSTPSSFRTSERQRAPIRNPVSFVAEDDHEENAPESYDLPPFAEIVAALADIDEATDDEGGTMDVEEIRLALAIELEVRDADGDAVRVTGSTPTQMTETTVMPVFHRLTMRITRESDA
jgi:hypothetical protein